MEYLFSANPGQGVAFMIIILILYTMAMLYVGGKLFGGNVIIRIEPEGIKTEGRDPKGMIPGRILRQWMKARDNKKPQGGQPRGKDKSHASARHNQ